MIYDLVILGGGPAGHTAAEAAAKAGLSVLLAERRALGGVCLNEGCIPSKAFLHSAKILEAMRSSARYGVVASGAEDSRLDHGLVLERKNRVVRRLREGIAARLKKHGVVVATGEATLRGRTSEGFEVDIGNDRVLGKRLLIATGSAPTLPTIEGLKEGLERGLVLTSREILDLATVPERLAIVGGGIVGLEMAAYFRAAGSRVVVVEILDRIASGLDREIGEALQKELAKKGIEFRLGTRLIGIEQAADLRLSFEGPDGAGTLEADKILVSVGRRPSVDGWKPGAVGLVVERGAIAADDSGRTAVEGVWAAGDVNGRSMLAHTAAHEAETCVDTMLGGAQRMNYDAVPSVIYTSPEAAAVGLTEEEAARRGVPVRGVRLPLSYSGRYAAENDGGQGFCRLIFREEDDALVGFHMIGNPASELAAGASMMIAKRMSSREIRETVFPHPTVGEIFRECAL